ncbi:MAG: XRE family transcriptional regulator [Anaerolineales bacterium]|nr:XRE family transcriptional regulator [Anaerolineales bacterium]
MENGVGMRLKFLRNQSGLSLRALSSRCGLSINAISQIERGENSPTVSTLQRLAAALEIPITDFFREDGRQACIFIRNYGGLQTQNEHITMESLGTGLANQQLVPFRMRLEAGSDNFDDLIAHPGEEFVFCLSGDLEYSVGDERFNLKLGDSLLFDATQPHAYRNSSPQPATMLIIFQAWQDPHLAPRLHSRA